MRITIKPSAAPDRELDLTGALVSAVAAELWRNFGGNDVVNWMEAERFIQSLVAPRPAGPAANGTTIEPRPRRRIVRPRDDGLRSPRRLDEDRITGPLPVY